MELTIEQRRALALARARIRLQEANPVELSGSGEVESIGRGLGRAGIKAVAGAAGPRLGSFISDAFWAIPRAAESAITGENKYLGPQFYSSQKTETALNNLAGTIINKPETGAGRIIESGADMGLSAVLGTGVSRAMQPAAQAVANALPNTVTRGVQAVTELGGQNPVVQGIAGTAAGFATQGADEAGIENPYGRLAIGLAAGGAAGIGAAKGGSLLDQYNYSRTLDSPEGLRRISGGIVADMATDPQAAAARLGRRNDYIPGVTPTGPAASRDPGLLAAQQQFQSLAPDDVSRNLQNNAARSAFIERDLGINPARDAAIEGRMNAANQIKPELWRNEQPVDITERLSTAIRGMGSEPGTDFQAVRSVEKMVLDLLQGRVTPIQRQTGTQPVMVGNRIVQEPIMETVGYTAKPSDLYALKRDLSMYMQSNDQTKYPNVKFAKGELNGVMKAIDDLIDEGAPGYKANFRDEFASAAKDRDRQTYIKDIVNKGSDTGTDAQGNRSLSPPKMLTQLAEARADSRRKDAGRMTMRDLAPEQRQALNALRLDMTQENLANSRGARTIGSPTARNIEFNRAIDEAVQAGTLPIPKTLLSGAGGLLGGALSAPLGNLGIGGGATGGAVAGRTLADVLAKRQDTKTAARTAALKREIGRMYSDPESLRLALIDALTKPVTKPQKINSGSALIQALIASQRSASE
jgi:hypothetical protein